MRSICASPYWPASWMMRLRSRNTRCALVIRSCSSRSLARIWSGLSAAALIGERLLHLAPDGLLLLRVLVQLLAPLADHLLDLLGRGRGAHDVGHAEHADHRGGRRGALRQRRQIGRRRQLHLLRRPLVRPSGAGPGASVRRWAGGGATCCGGARRPARRRAAAAAAAAGAGCAAGRDEVARVALRQHRRQRKQQAGRQEGRPNQAGDVQARTSFRNRSGKAGSGRICCLTTASAKSMLIRPNGVFHDTPTPAPTRGAASVVHRSCPAAALTWDSAPTSTKARPLRPRSDEIGSGKRSSVDCV